METQKHYEIRIEGQLNRNWATSWFEGFCLRYEGQNETVLTGQVIDQAALHGVLMRIRDLGIPLISVNKVESAVCHL